MLNDDAEERCRQDAVQLQGRRGQETLAMAQEGNEGRNDVDDYCARSHGCAASSGPGRRRRGTTRTHDVAVPMGTAANGDANGQEGARATTKKQRRRNADRMKTRYDQQTDAGGFHEDDQVWISEPT